MNAEQRISLIEDVANAVAESDAGRHMEHIAIRRNAIVCYSTWHGAGNPMNRIAFQVTLHRDERENAS